MRDELVDPRHRSSHQRVEQNQPQSVIDWKSFLASLDILQPIGSLYILDLFGLHTVLILDE